MPHLWKFCIKKLKQGQRSKQRSDSEFVLELEVRTHLSARLLTPYDEMRLNLSLFYMIRVPAQ